MKSLALALTLLSAPLAALGNEAELPRKNDILEASGTAVALRESTPDALFGGKAAQIGWVRKGELVRALDTRQYLSIFGMEIWVEVQKISEPAIHGWVLDGMGADITRGKSSLSISQSAPGGHQPSDARAAAAAAAAKAADSLVEDSE